MNTPTVSVVRLNKYYLVRLLDRETGRAFFTIKISEAKWKKFGMSSVEVVYE